MTSFKSTFLNEQGTPTFEIVVSQEVVGNETKVMVESNNFQSDPVTVRFKLNQTSTVETYLRLLLRTHMEEVFDETLESIHVDHIGGQIRIYEYPNFHYFNKLNYLREKKFEYESKLFNFPNGSSLTSTATPSPTPTGTPAGTTAGTGTGPAPTPPQPDTTYY